MTSSMSHLSSCGSRMRPGSGDGPLFGGMSGSFRRIGGDDGKDAAFVRWDYVAIGRRQARIFGVRACSPIYRTKKWQMRMYAKSAYFRATDLAYIRVRRRP